jgi:hypothetical protein
MRDRRVSFIAMKGIETLLGSLTNVKIQDHKETQTNERMSF